MTHEELLAELNELDDNCSVVGITVAALRAVVELHKPNKWHENFPAVCAGCEGRCGCFEGDIMDYNTWDTCPTIKAIEKELGE